MIIGSHVQMKAPEYVDGSVSEALSYGANALMLYTGAPQNTRRTDIEKLRIPEAISRMKENNLPMERIIVHAPYVINPANSTKPEVGELAVSFFEKEMERTAAIGAKYMVLHPGSYTDTDLETGIQTAISQLNKAVCIPEGLTVCLETMAGKGTEIGFRFEQIAAVLEGLKYSDRYGVCLDTCHINDAGYDLSDFDSVLDEFDHIIGLSKLHVIHLNDSLNPRGSHKDRHANIGKGTIGFDNLHSIAVNSRCENIAKILETPYINGKAPYREEIEMLRTGIYKDPFSENRN
jgi:deoxyribonuclease-4